MTSPGAKMSFREMEEQKPVKPTVLTAKLDDLIKWVKTQYHGELRKNNMHDDFHRVREARNAIYREKKQKALGKWDYT